MILFVLILIIRYASGYGNLSNATLLEVRKLNELGYSHESTVIGREATFHFIIHNTSYARHELEIDSYYYSITFIDEEHHEERGSIEDLPTNETEYHGELKMENLEAEGNYLICIFFFKNQTVLIGSSRFCHVVSVSDTCHLEVREATFSNQHVFILLGFVVVVLTFTVLFSCIRDYIYRPRTIEALLKTLPDHHAQNLETLAPQADDRRRRRTQPALNTRLREASVLTIDYDPNADHNYFNYHGHDNASLDILPE